MTGLKISQPIVRRAIHLPLRYIILFTLLKSDLNPKHTNYIFSFKRVRLH